MIITKNRKWALSIVLLFFVWGGVSYQWYTCGIKNFCERDIVEVHIGGEDGIKINKTN